MLEIGVGHRGTVLKRRLNYAARYEFRGREANPARRTQTDGVFGHEFARRSLGTHLHLVGQRRRDRPGSP